MSLKSTEEQITEDQLDFVKRKECFYRGETAIFRPYLYLLMMTNPPRKNQLHASLSSGFPFNKNNTSIHNNKSLLKP